MDTLVFTSEKYPNVYIFGVVHNICNNEIINFLETLKVDIVVLEDPLPFVYLSPLINKISETIYLKTILSDNIKKYYSKACKIVNKYYLIQDENKFTRKLIPQAFNSLNKLNMKSKIKIISADPNIETILELENELYEYTNYLNSNRLITEYKRLETQCLNLFIQKQYIETFLLQAIYFINSPFYNMEFEYISERNKNWAENLTKNIFSKHKNQTIVMFFGNMHLNQFIENNLIDILSEKYGINFTCKLVNKICPSQILIDLIIEKEKANEIYKMKEIKLALNIYLSIFEKYKMYCSYRELNILKEYSNIIANIITCYYKLDDKINLKQIIKISKKYITYYKLELYNWPLHIKIRFIINKILPTYFSQEK